MSRPYDVVLYGATGFTGQQTAHYFDAHVGSRLSWAIAGRNRGKLEALKRELSTDVGIEVADGLDRDALDALTAKTRVVASTAGPFARFGSDLVAACVANKTHYVDITGETPWVRDLIDEHHEQAREDGTRIVPMCGFDSIPSDIGAYLVARHAQQELGEDVVSVRGFHSISGGLNGGTLASALTSAESGDSRRIGDPVLLNPRDTRDATRPKVSRDPRGPEYSEDLGAWAAPFVMSRINSRVVRRSAALLEADGEGYGTRFDYQEYLKAGTRLRAWLNTWVLISIFGAIQSKRLRKVVKRLGPSPGEGPSEETMDNGFMKLRLFGETESGTQLRGIVSRRGDAGNRNTVLMLCESALCLAEDLDDLPDRAGLLTPATAFGDVLVERLRAQDMTLSVESA